MLAASQRNTPLWLDLAISAAAVAVAFRIDRRIGGRRRGDSSQAIEGAGPEPSSSPRSARHEQSKGAVDTRPAHEPHTLQRRRATQRNRGRDARSPTDIPRTGWKDILWRTYRQIQDDRLLAVAAGVVFYMLLALFPALAALVSLYGLFTDPVAINEHLTLLAGFMPEGAIEIVREQVTRLVQTSSGGLGFGVVFGLGLALWSANAGMKAIIDALNVVYDESEKRGFVKLTLVAFAFTLGALAFVMLALGAVVVLPLVLSWFGLASSAAQLLALLRWPALLVILLLWLAVLYRYGPNRTRARWQWLSVGSLFAAFAWLAGSALFSWYLSNFADYDATYGSLGAAIGLMMWLWLSVIVILVGGELNAEIEHQTAQDTTVPPQKPLGRRGAVMANTGGEPWA